MKILTEGYALNITKKFTGILEKEIKAAGVDTTNGVIVNFRDPGYSAEKGGYHPVEVMISGDGRIRYVTDFSFVGTPPQVELAKELDFDFDHNVFQQMGHDFPIGNGRSLFRTWQANFCAYHRDTTYETQVVSC